MLKRSKQILEDVNWIKDKTRWWKIEHWAGKVVIMDVSFKETSGHYGYRANVSSLSSKPQIIQVYS